MKHILLQGNRRFGTLFATSLLFGVVLGVWRLVAGQATLDRALGGLLAIVLIPVLLVGWRFCAGPRLAITDRELLVYVRATKPPYAVPLEVVEVFFIGQGAITGDEPGQPREYNGAVAANVIVRLAEAAKDWHGRDANLWLAVWREGYITIRGLWCEDINQEVLQILNKRLLAAKRQYRELGQEL